MDSEMRGKLIVLVVVVLLVVSIMSVFMFMDDDPAEVVGTWERKHWGGLSIYTFYEDNTLERETLPALTYDHNQSYTVDGTWKLDGDKLCITFDPTSSNNVESQQWINGTYVFKDDGNKLIFHGVSEDTEEEHTYRFYRLKDGTELEQLLRKELVGEWRRVKKVNQNRIVTPDTITFYSYDYYEVGGNLSQYMPRSGDWELYENEMVLGSDDPVNCRVLIHAEEEEMEQQYEPFSRDGLQQVLTLYFNGKSVMFFNTYSE